MTTNYDSLDPEKTVQLHLPEGSIAVLQNELLKSFEDANNANDNAEHTNESKTSETAGLSNIVAQHYNQLEEKGLAERTQSRIFHMRNLNNWVKSQLIGSILEQIRRDKGYSHPINVLDLGCGKGGDLLKWERGNVNQVVCADIAETSVEQCKQRYENLSQRSRRVFKAEFITADCTKVTLHEKMENPSMMLDLVSCQFAFHYSFESLSQAEQMMTNISHNLRPGGYFIGTTPDAYDIIRRLNLKEDPTNRKFGNEVFSVEFPSDTKLDPPALFGAKYCFHLEEVVDCPEFLVHFPTLEKLAARHGLRLVEKTRFEDFIEKEMVKGKDLLIRMKALETYPPYNDRELVSKVKSDYDHAEEYINSSSKEYRTRIGTLSKAEWEATSLYLVFIFQKMTDSGSGKRKLSESKDEESK